MADNKQKRVAMVVLGISVLIQIVAGVIYGKQGQHFMMSLSLSGSILMSIFFSLVLVAWKIDTQFKRLEDILKQKGNSSNRGAACGKEADALHEEV